MKNGVFSGTFFLLLGCASMASDQGIFKQPRERVGMEIIATGYLKYGFENRNLFPSRNWELDWSHGRCLPVGIDATDEQLIARAQDLDGHRVEVRGTVEELVSENEVSASFCKNIGIRIRELRKVE